MDAMERERFYKSGFGKQIKYLILEKLELLQKEIAGRSSVG